MRLYYDKIEIYDEELRVYEADVKDWVDGLISRDLEVCGYRPEILLQWVKNKPERDSLPMDYRSVFDEVAWLVRAETWNLNNYFLFYLEWNESDCPKFPNELIITFFEIEVKARVVTVLNHFGVVAHNDHSATLISPYPNEPTDKPTILETAKAFSYYTYLRTGCVFL